MEHYRSVFATSAAIVFGLVAASQIAYPRGPEVERVRAKVFATVDTDEAGPSAWSDPPGAMLGVAALATPVEAPSAETKPASFTQLGAETATLFTAVPLAEVPMAAAPQAGAAPAKRRRTARRPIPLHTAAATLPARAIPATPAQSMGQSSESGEKRVDLIGSLLKGLGIGREG